MFNVISTLSGTECRIYINDILHVAINGQVNIIQTWHEDHPKYGHVWCIELCVGVASTILEYDTEDKWKTILSHIPGTKRL